VAFSSVNQLERMYEQKRYAREIKEAMDLVKSYQVGTEIFYDRLVVGPFKDLDVLSGYWAFFPESWKPLPELGIASWRPEKKYIVTFDTKKIRIRIFFYLVSKSFPVVVIKSLYTDLCSFTLQINK
jgi:hypothetical protein